MLQTQTICHSVPNVRPQRTSKPKKKYKKPESPVKKAVGPKNPPISVCGDAFAEEKDDAQVTKSNEIEKEEPKKEGKAISLGEYLKMKKIEERRAKEKKAEEDRERFVKEATERKEAERAEVIKQAKRMILYRKPMCRRVNQGLLISECLRELDAQIKFRETIKNVDKDKEMNGMRADVAKYEEEMKEKAKKLMETRKMYTAELKKQIEENKTVAMTKQMEEFEAEKQDQINMKKSLEEIQKYEEQQLINKKEKMKQFFKDAIEEKKQYELKLKREEEFEDRANEIYQNSKIRIEKMLKSIAQKQKEERHLRVEMVVKPDTLSKSNTELEEKISKKAIEEQEEHYQERQRIKKEREDETRKMIHDRKAEAEAAKVKQLQEEKELKKWETMQIFKKVERDKEWEAEERKRVWNKKMECATALKKLMSEKETRENLEKLHMEQAADSAMKVIEKENQKLLDYADEVLKESEGVRPLYPILKAVEECKKKMGLIVPKKRGEVIDPVPKRRRNVPFKCTKTIPEDKVLYL